MSIRGRERRSGNGSASLVDHAMAKKSASASVTARMSSGASRPIPHRSCRASPTSPCPPSPATASSRCRSASVRSACEQGSVHQFARHQQHRDGGGLIERVGLDDERRTRFAEVTGQRDRHQIGSLHVSLSPSRAARAASMKASRSRSAASAAATILDCRRHSSANPGRRLSGAHIWIGRKDACRRPPLSF